MGVFDKVLGKKDEGPLSLSQQEAFAAVCVLSVAADGVVEDDEIRRVVTNLAEKRLFRGTRINDLGNMLNNTAKLIQRRGAAPIMEAAKKSLPQDLRETAFALAADLVLSDGEVDKKEKDFLEEFQTALGLDEATAVKVVEVMIIKNRG